MGSYRLFGPNFMDLIFRVEMKAASLNHRLGKFIDLEVKGATFAQSAGCVECGTGVTIVERDGKVSVVGDCVEHRCGEFPCRKINRRANAEEKKTRKRNRR